jgi:oligosaccharyl transferase (archaeosortase A-associated)
MSRPNNQATICAAILALVFFASLALRIAVPWDQVFAGGWIKFTDNDAYFYVRLLDNLSRHFPLLGSYDPYNIYPGGRDLSGQPLFFVYCMGFFAWLLGGGSPSQHTVDLVGVFFPAGLGALLVLPVFFIGRAIFNKWAGLAAAGFIALMPGEFLIRTLLGNTDSHALEILLSTLFMLFLLLSIQAGKGLSTLPRQRYELREVVKPLLYGLLAGACLGLYILSWQGAPLFIFISFTWLALQAVSDHLRGRPLVYLGVTGVSAFLCALLLALAGAAGMLPLLSLGISAAGAAALAALSMLMRRLNLRIYLYPVIVVALAAAGLLALRMINPQLLNIAADTMAGFFSWDPGVTIAEMQPLLINQGNFTLALLWGNYTSASALAAFALAIVLYRALRRGQPEMMLLAVWSIIILLSALAMRRFAYYLAVDAAILAGYTGWLLLRLCGLRDSAGEAVTVTATKKGGGKKVAARRRPPGNPALTALGIAAVAFIVIYPNTGPLPGGDRPCFDVASRALFPPSDAWCRSMDWLRDNTAQPFGKDGYYYDYYGRQPSLIKKTADYSVLCWWDYGYWVTRMGQRIPLTNPGSAQLGEQLYFIAPGGREAAQSSAGWNMRYVVVNDYLVNWNTGFRVVAADAGEKVTKYCEVYYRQQKDGLAPTLLYYPEYYRTMAVRLYCFDGKAYTPAETAAISWEAKTGSDSLPYKEITGLKTFSSYGEASAFLAAQQGGNWRIVGKDPLASPIPLEALEGYRPAFASPEKARVGNSQAPEVKIFEYNP